MEEAEYRVVFEDGESAIEAYQSGLQHGLVSTPIQPVPEKDTPCHVWIELAFLGRTFRAKGAVVHPSDVATVIWLQEVPDELRRLILDLESAPTSHRARPRKKAELLSEEEQQLGLDGASVVVPKAAPVSTSLRDRLAKAKKVTWDEDNPAPGVVPPEKTAPQTTAPAEAAPKKAAPKKVAPKKAAPKKAAPKKAAPKKAAPRKAAAPTPLSSVRQPTPPAQRAAPARPPTPPVQKAVPTRSPTPPAQKAAPARKAPSRTRPPSAEKAESPAARRVHRTPTPDDQSQRYGFPLPNGPERQVPAVVRLQGDFATSNPWDMMLRLRASKFTGVGVIRTGGTKYWMYVMEGEPVEYRRDPPLHAMSIEALLVRRELLPTAVLGEVRLLADVTGRSLVSIVMRMGLVTEAALDGLRREQVAAVTKRLLDVDEGDYQFFEFPNIAGVYRDRPTHLLKTLWQHAKSSVQEAGTSRRRAWSDTFRRHHVMTTDAGDRLRSELPLNEQERKLVERSRRPGRPVPRLLKHTRMDGQSALDALLALERMGVLTLCSTDVEEEGDSELEKRVRQRFGKLHKDHFQFLELHWSALPEELRERCDQVERELVAFDKAAALITNFGQVREKVKGRLDGIRKLADAPIERKKYRKNLVGEAKLTMTAEQMVQQGEMALFREDPDAAKECFRRAEEVEPGGAGSYKRVARVREVLDRLGEDSEIPEFG